MRRMPNDNFCADCLTGKGQCLARYVVAQRGQNSRSGPHNGLKPKTCFIRVHQDDHVFHVGDRARATVHRRRQQGLGSSRRLHLVQHQAEPVRSEPCQKRARWPTASAFCAWRRSRAFGDSPRNALATVHEPSSLVRTKSLHDRPSVASAPARVSFAFIRRVRREPAHGR